MVDCTGCKRAIRGESGIRCNGVCGKLYHEKCCGLDKSALAAIETNNLLRFICEDCMQYIQNVDYVLREVQTEVSRSNSCLSQYKDEFSNALKTNELELKCLLEAMESRFNDRIVTMKKVEENCTKSLNRIVKCFKSTEEYEATTAKLCNEAKLSFNKNEELITEIKEVVNNTKQILQKTERLSYAEVTSHKNFNAVPKIRSDLPLLIKPVVSQSKDDTVKDLTQNVDPTKLLIKRVIHKPDGVILIKSANEKDRKEIKEALVNGVGAKYDISEPKTLKPRCLITGMNYSKSPEELMDLLIKQNVWLDRSGLEIIKIYEVRKDNRIYHNAIVQTDAVNFTMLMKQGAVNIGWDRCKVYDGVDLLVCFKCRGFNHKAATCKYDLVCTKCLGNHQLKECTSEKKIKCINCIRANNDLSLGLNDNHITGDRLCPVYLKKIEEKKKIIGY